MIIYAKQEYIQSLNISNTEVAVQCMMYLKSNKKTLQ